ncbi:Hypothetical predicted protein [Lecanosticta acicola]|uniref:Uncharacterized protein n=1 Tax=Lecanosticta acicola TaxID=111012 RepID=A0AAI9EFJ3_9PEZI|nr:Hypothetical predicted protein [Lecanosticta acicola]
MSSKDSHLYGGERKRNLNNGKEISSSTTLSFTSQLSSLINSSKDTSSPKQPTGRSKAKKEDIFATHNRNSAKRAKRDLEPDHAGTFEQKHTTNGEALDKNVWERSKRKMEEKARLYAAMKRGDIDDTDERYAVDFDTKWAAARAEGKDDISDDEDLESDKGVGGEEIEYLDEFGRLRKGTQLDALRAQQELARMSSYDDRFTARPAAPENVIYGDAIQHEAFNPDAPIAQQMEALARKRDKSLTPPPDEHFDSNKEVRTKGTGFFQFSEDAEQRERQMQDLENERAETERKRADTDGKLSDRRAQLEARKDEVRRRIAKRKADEFLEQLSAQMSKQSADEKGPDTTENTSDRMMNRGQGAARKDVDD